MAEEQPKGPTINQVLDEFLADQEAGLHRVRIARTRP